MQPAFQEQEFSDIELADMAEEMVESEGVSVWEAIIVVVCKHYFSRTSRRDKIEVVNAEILRRRFERLKLASREKADKFQARCDEREERISH